jgi:hypothetical protein
MMDRNALVHRVYRLFQARFRPARLKAFLAYHAPSSATTILDVGGTAQFWETADVELRVTILNVTPPPEGISNTLTYVQGDATHLPFPDDAFDIVFSNSMIEHLGSRDGQEAFAREAQRVGRGIWVQTPARWFPVEPHLLTPLIHYLPRRVQRLMLRNFTVWGLITRPDSATVDQFLDETRLLSAAAMRSLFPGCQLLRERVLGMTKSLISVARPAGAASS